MAVRVLVVDDAALVRRHVVDALRNDPGIEVVGTAADGVEALAKIRELAPDVVTLDVMMPRLDGLKVLAHLPRERPVRVLMLSSLTHEGAEVTLQALELGAIDFVDKSLLGDAARGGLSEVELAAKVRGIAAVDPVRLLERAAPAAPSGPVAAARAGASAAEVVVIGASTGGPRALERLLPRLPGDLPAGVVVVQHMPVGFTAALASRLDGLCALRVREAPAGAPVVPGTVLVAPGGLHLALRRDDGGCFAHLSTDPADAPLRPSVDVTMRSAAAVVGSRCVGVLLTGMGTDGAAGMWAIRAAGGRTLAESEDSAVVYGMPRAAVERGAVETLAPLEELAPRILRACCEGR